MDAVTEIVLVRGRDAGGLNRMVGASVLAHIGLIGGLILAPASWLGTVEPVPENIMVISLGGAPGPRDGGLTMMGGRPTQTAVPDTSKPEPIRPPAAREPEMIEPRKDAPKKPETKIQDTAKDPKSRTPTKGQEIQKGTAVAETGAKGMGFGLSSAGGGGTGSYLETANFCCPEYISTMLDLIRRNWDSKQQAGGTTVMKFTIQPDGTLTGIQIEKPSGYPALDLMANRAMILTKKLPPLPVAFTEPSLTVHLVFEYQR